ncbi:MAG TPA: Na/Pi cotransporter family protein [Syntrophales bacterium]|nr:Na/Pi cotransporter family protein [Syntrophales bacterium]
MIKGILLFATGVALFLYGMIRLSTEVQQQFSNVRMREYFQFAVKNPFYGLITGIVTTVLFQSSTATSVLTVGMVSAGLMSFYRSLGIILGADIGTTFTVQLVVWKITDAAPVFIMIGGLLWSFGKEKWQSFGEGIFYFGLLFFGLSLISEATAPLKDSQSFLQFSQETRNPVMGVLIGLLFAFLIHSSAIPISILVIMAQQNLITLDNALPIVYGANIGTAVTALMAGFVSNINGKRSALSHFLFKLFGALICIFAATVIVQVLRLATNDVPQQIAYGHLLFNAVIAFVFIFLLRPFSYLVEYLLPGKAEILPIWPEFLNEMCLSKAEDALECVKKELRRELVLARGMLVKAMDLLKGFKESARKDILYVELVVNNLRREVGSYLCRIPSDSLSEDLSRVFFSYSGVVDDIERIADHAVNLANLIKQKYERKISFTKWGHEDLNEIVELVVDNLKDAISLMEKADEAKIKAITDREEVVDRKVKESRERHQERFYKGVCQVQAGPVFIEMLINLERISDHCQNIADHAGDMKNFNHG